MIDLLQIILILAALLLALLAPRLRVPGWRRVKRAFVRLALWRRCMVLLVGLLGFLCSAALSMGFGRPEPRIHDEFSYLLSADTLAQRRLANPPHPMRIHFESFHIIQHPTYASKYPPGQGLVLAAGQVLGGHPIVGVWLSMGLCCAGICWMLQGWLPPRWALVGALLVLVRLVFFGVPFSVGIQGYWSQSYYGGAVAALGGALLFGALRRLFRRPTVGLSTLLGLGLAILANSRPFEGVVVSLPAAGLLLAWAVSRRGPPAWVFLGRVVLPIALVLALTAVAMGYVNWRTTEDPLLMAYEVHERTYSVPPFLIWLPMRSEVYHNHRVIREFYDTWVRDSYLGHQTWPGFIERTNEKYEVFCGYYLCLAFLVPLGAFFHALGERWTRFAILTWGLLVLALLQGTWFIPHYAAPAASLFFFILMQFIRRLRLFRWRQRPVGRYVAGAVLIASLVVLVPSLLWEQRAYRYPWERMRAQMIADLKRTDQQHLIIVRYTADHAYYTEWVYNEADIDGARVVWARDLGPEQNRRLVEYFKDRKVWLLVYDASKAPELVPYE